ncbi:surface lipoprotein assembly modifier [Marinobacterium arenosum]|uniref:surface lipoprotein assembly modifier n=1 Tax=Marinobacterium arenosum TaxID=2862496 RepID=UPI001C9899A8|nr:surface lipoprotein assembly modifier [Marinobacterium arenosum]MBY4676309.1 surface lipoprotein assembly modifier [Marinobacterium arenosum]
MTEAYALGQQLLDRYEGEPAFDLQYGIAAIDSGHIDFGMFALERVLILQPDMHVARLELARAYFLKGDDQRARQEFHAVLEKNPPPQVVEQIRTFLALIDQRAYQSPWAGSGRLQLAWGYDDNINSSPDGQTSLVTLNEAALGRGDQFGLLKLNGEFSYRVDKARSWYGNGGLETRGYRDEDQQNFQNYSLAGGSRWQLGAHRLQLGLNAQHYVLDNEDYRDSYGIAGEWTYGLSPTSIITTALNYSQLDYDAIDWKDSDQLSLSLSMVKAGNGRWSPLYFAGAFIGREKPDTAGLLADAGVDRHFYGGHIGLRLQPTAQLQVTSTLVAQLSDYQGEDWLYGIKRSDDYLSLAVDLSWQFANAWSAIAGYSYTRNDSNIELYDYDRNQLRLGVQYQF